MHTGVYTRIGTIVPKLGSIKQTVSLSKEAKLRLKWIDYYYSHSNNAIALPKQNLHFLLCFRYDKNKYHKSRNSLIARLCKNLTITFSTTQGLCCITGLWWHF